MTWQRGKKKEKSFFFFFLTKHGAFRLPRKVVINVFSLGNPTPLANEGGIYHLHCGGRCREDSNPSAWEQFTFPSLIVPEKCDRFKKKTPKNTRVDSSSEQNTTTHNGRHFKIQDRPNSSESIIYGKEQKIRKAITPSSTAADTDTFNYFPSLLI